MTKKQAAARLIEMKKRLKTESSKKTIEAAYAYYLYRFRKVA